MSPKIICVTTDKKYMDAVTVKIDYCECCFECPFYSLNCFCNYYDTDEFEYESCELWRDINESRKN